MSKLGVYFGPQVISLVESKGSKLINSIQIPQGMISPVELLEEKVPKEIKIFTLLKGELSKNKIEPGEAIVSLSGRDLIVRTFEMPVLARQELEAAVKFEIKKYIPFKIEDLVSDFQYKLDKPIQKFRVLFVGIKKETLNEYLYIFSQSGLKVKSIEYSAFSLLRLFKAANIKEKGIIAVVNVDLAKDDEVNFVVLEDGFPLFSRDITLIGAAQEAAQPKEAQPNEALEKLKREIQISIDYYGRKFPSKNIKKIFFITNPDYQNNLEGGIREWGVDIQFIDINNLIDRPVPFSLGFAKAYSSSLFTVDTGIKINLLAAKKRLTEEISAEEARAVSWVTGIKLNPIAVTACLLIFAAIFTIGGYRTSVAQAELKKIINKRPQVSLISPEVSYEELLAADSNYKSEIQIIENIAKKRLYLTSLLDAIPNLTPKGVWLVNLSFRKNSQKIELILEGSAYLGNSNAELELVNRFLSRLKESTVFAEYFKEIAVTSVDYNQGTQVNKTNFTISCRASLGKAR